MCRLSGVRSGLVIHSDSHRPAGAVTCNAPSRSVTLRHTCPGHCSFGVTLLQFWGYATSFLRRQALTIPNPVPRLSSNRIREEPEKRLWKSEEKHPDRKERSRKRMGSGWCVAWSCRRLYPARSRHVAPGSPLVVYRALRARGDRVAGRSVLGHPAASCAWWPRPCS